MKGNNILWKITPLSKTKIFGKKVALSSTFANLFQAWLWRRQLVSLVCSALTCSTTAHPGASEKCLVHSGEWKWQIRSLHSYQNSFDLMVSSKDPQATTGAPISRWQLFWCQNQCGSQLTVSIWEDVHRPQANGIGYKIQLQVKGGRKALQPKLTQTLWAETPAWATQNRLSFFAAWATIIPGVHPFLWVNSRQLFFIVIFLFYLSWKKTNSREIKGSLDRIPFLKLFKIWKSNGCVWCNHYLLYLY